jgi:hypothetical protein
MKKIEGNIDVPRLIAKLEILKGSLGSLTRVIDSGNNTESDHRIHLDCDNILCTMQTEEMSRGAYETNIPQIVIDVGYGRFFTRVPDREPVFTVLIRVFFGKRKDGYFEKRTTVYERIVAVTERRSGEKATFFKDSILNGILVDDIDPEHLSQVITPEHQERIKFLNRICFEGC